MYCIGEVGHGVRGILQNVGNSYLVLQKIVFLVFFYVSNFL